MCDLEDPASDHKRHNNNNPENDNIILNSLELWNHQHHSKTLQPVQDVRVDTGNPHDAIENGQRDKIQGWPCRSDSRCDTPSPKTSHGRWSPGSCSELPLQVTATRAWDGGKTSLSLWLLILWLRMLLNFMWSHAVCTKNEFLAACNLGNHQT